MEPGDAGHALWLSESVAVFRMFKAGRSSRLNYLQIVHMLFHILRGLEFTVSTTDNYLEICMPQTQTAAGGDDLSCVHRMTWASACRSSFQVQWIIYPNMTLRDRRDAKIHHDATEALQCNTGGATDLADTQTQHSTG